MEINLILLLLFLPLLPFGIYLIGKRKTAGFLVQMAGFFELGIATFIIIKMWGQEMLHNWTFLKIADSTFMQYGLWINNYSLALLLVVAIVSLLVRLYAYTYLENEKRRSWFLVLIGFFTFAMYGLVLSSNLLGMFFFWEWVGLASYLMIGFWYQKPEAAEAARKAFMYNKLGDLGLILALGIFYIQFGSFNIAEITEQNFSSNQWSIWFSFGLLIAAFAKSAQLPFSNWLADAMEGPTPASALIHSATMVTAGIYLLIRCYAFINPLVLEICLYLGIITVIWAGITALKQNDIKKILAFSTISQLGFMLLGIASGNIQAAFFHLITHAFFKSSLFLSAGVLINQQGQYLKDKGFKDDAKDIRLMSGFWQKSPILTIMIIMGAMALSALPLFSGFLSKEAIIAGLEGKPLIYALALLATLITALYSGRIIFHLLKPDEKHVNVVNLSVDLRANLKYYIPISVLVVLSFSFIYALNPFDYAESWFYKGLTLSDKLIKGSVLLVVISGLLSFGGILIAYFLIFRGQKDIGFGKTFDKAFYNGLYLDHFLSYSFKNLNLAGTALVITIERNFIDRLIQFFTYSTVFVAMLFRLFDSYIIDGFVITIARISSFIGGITRQFQGGKLQNYLFWLLLFVLIILILIY